MFIVVISLFVCVCVRFVVHGKSFLKQVEPGTASVFNYAKTYQIKKMEVGNLTHSHRGQVALLA